jgi:hypothetical protein
MNLGSKIKKAVTVALFSAGAVATAVPAQAGGLGRGLLGGLIGGVALGAFAAAAQAQQQGGAQLLAGLPDDAGAPEYIEETRPEIVSGRRGRARPSVRARVSSPGRAPALAASSGAVTRCRDAITAQALKVGAVDVSVSSAGSQARARDGDVLLPIAARIEYARKGLRDVRKARVTCRIDTDGQVVSLR